MDEYQKCNEYALRLCLSLASRFPAVEGFQALPDLYGRLSQIDNMTCKLPVGYEEAHTSFTPDQRDWIRKNYEALRAAGWRNPEASPSDASVKP